MMCDRTTMPSNTMLFAASSFSCSSSNDTRFQRSRAFLEFTGRGDASYQGEQQCSESSVAKSMQRNQTKSSILVWSQKLGLKFTLVVVVLIMMETKFTNVQGFLSQAVTGPIRMRKFPHCEAGLSIHDKSERSTYRDRNWFMSSSSIHTKEQETATVPLEWIEYYTPDSEGDEIPVLFLHGLLGNKRNFSTCASMLARQIDKKRRIIGVDLRNHGETQPWLENMSYPNMAEDVVQFLKSQNIERVVLVGHSMGGKVAQALAILYPELVAGLVVLDIAPVTYCREEDPHWRAVEDILRAVHQVIEDLKESGAETSKREIDLALRKSIPDPALRAFVLTNFDSRNNRWKIPIAIMVEELERIAGFDLSSVDKPVSSSTYDGDVFIINGGQSRFVRHAYMDQIASYFPNHMLTTIRGSGHWVHAEAPDDLVALLKRYLDR